MKVLITGEAITRDVDDGGTGKPNAVWIAERIAGLIRC